MIAKQIGGAALQKIAPFAARGKGGTPGRIAAGGQTSRGTRAHAIHNQFDPIDRGGDIGGIKIQQRRQIRAIGGIRADLGSGQIVVDDHGKAARFFDPATLLGIEFFHL